MGVVIVYHILFILYCRTGSRASRIATTETQEAIQVITSRDEAVRGRILVTIRVRVRVVLSEGLPSKGVAVVIGVIRQHLHKCCMRLAGASTPNPNPNPDPNSPNPNPKFPNPNPDWGEQQGNGDRHQQVAVGARSLPDPAL